jgi:hypothetical protein
VRRILCSFVLLSFAVTLQASVPALTSASRFDRTAGIQPPSQPVFSQGRPVLTLTAAPADVSFYEEFYPENSLQREQPPKPGMLHRFTSLIKKAVGWI